MKRRFLTKDEPMLVSMLQAYTPERVLELMEHSRAEGADAFGMQFCRMKKEYRTRETYERLFAAAGEYPVYVTNYRQGENSLKSDEQLARKLVELAECGATLCDVMGDYFERTEGEMTYSERAIEKQMALIDEIHSAGAQVVMSSHVLKFIPAEQVLAIALEHQRRGADICKIVTGASNMEEQIENLRTVTLLKNELDIPFLCLSGGESRILRRIGGEVGCCMYLCVHEHDELATPAQPLISEVRTIRDNLR